jgi:hypothetical protein
MITNLSEINVLVYKKQQVQNRMDKITMELAQVNLEIAKLCPVKRGDIIQRNNKRYRVVRVEWDETMDAWQVEGCVVTLDGRDKKFGPRPGVSYQHIYFRNLNQERNPVTIVVRGDNA